MISTLNTVQSVATIYDAPISLNTQFKVHIHRTQYNPFHNDTSSHEKNNVYTVSMKIVLIASMCSSCNRYVDQFYTTFTNILLGKYV